MSQTFSAGQSPARDCFCHHVTMIHFPGETKRAFSETAGVDGKTLQAARVNRFNGKIVRERAYHLRADSKIYLFASAWPGLYFFVTYDQYRQRFDCSCEVPYCEHIRQMAAISRR